MRSKTLQEILLISFIITDLQYVIAKAENPNKVLKQEGKLVPDILENKQESHHVQIQMQPKVNSALQRDSYKTKQHRNRMKTLKMILVTKDETTSQRKEIHEYLKNSRRQKIEQGKLKRRSNNILSTKKSSLWRKEIYLGQFSRDTVTQKINGAVPPYTQVLQSPREFVDKNEQDILSLRKITDKDNLKHSIPPYSQVINSPEDVVTTDANVLQSSGEFITENGNAVQQTIPPYTKVLDVPKDFQIEVENVIRSPKEFIGKSVNPVKHTIPPYDKALDSSREFEDDKENVDAKIKRRQYVLKQDQYRADEKERRKKRLKYQTWKGFNFYGKNSVRTRTVTALRSSYTWSYINLMNTETSWHYWTERVGFIAYYDSEYVEYDLPFPMATYVPRKWDVNTPHPHGLGLLGNQLFSNILKAMAQQGGSTFTRGPRPWHFEQEMIG